MRIRLSQGIPTRITFLTCKLQIFSINSQSLEDTQVGYISQKNTLDKNTLDKYTFGKKNFGKIRLGNTLWENTLWENSRLGKYTSFESILDSEKLSKPQYFWETKQHTSKKRKNWRSVSVSPEEMAEKVR